MTLIVMPAFPAMTVWTIVELDFLKDLTVVWLSLLPLPRPLQQPQLLQQPQHLQPQQLLLLQPRQQLLLQQKPQVSTYINLF